MKKFLSCILIAICMFSVCSCNNSAVTENKTDLCAFIKEIKDNTIIIDVAEYITSENTERIAELNLTEQDMINGYYINNTETKLEEYILTDETIYTFIDWKNDFVENGENREVTTTSKEDFIKYLNTYEDAQPGMPFFFNTVGNKVISITEKIMM